MLKAEKKKKGSRTSRTLNVIGLILCLLMLPVVIVNMTMFVQTLVRPDSIPNFMGYTPVIVTSGSMSGTFEAKDLVVIHASGSYRDLPNDTIVTYLSEEKLVTHRIIGREPTSNGGFVYITKGDANNTADAGVAPSQIVGVYTFHIPNIGGFALFMQTPQGIILFVVIPLIVLFILFAVLDKLRYNRLLKEKEAENSRYPISYPPEQIPSEELPAHSAASDRDI